DRGGGRTWAGHRRSLTRQAFQPRHLEPESPRDSRLPLAVRAPSSASALKRPAPLFRSLDNIGRPPQSSRSRRTWSVQGQRLLAAIEAEIKNISKLEHSLARTKIVLQEQASRLRLGTNPELVMTSLRLTVPHETTLALIERVDPVLSTHAELPPKN